MPGRVSWASAGKSVDLSFTSIKKELYFGSAVTIGYPRFLPADHSQVPLRMSFDPGEGGRFCAKRGLGVG